LAHCIFVREVGPSQTDFLFALIRPAIHALLFKLEN
jgi:hypothetical protein